MKVPRDVHGDQAAQALIRLGFSTVRQTGSHRIMRKAARTVVVPQHKPMKPGTLAGIIKQAGLTLEEFKDAL
jgi:predicted RNA binding protein YcfA (HicA-like mRNA interferase family)